jgi:hypothetical protein
MGFWQFIVSDEGPGSEVELLSDLEADFHEEVRLGRQIAAHAGRTRYAWMGEALRALAGGHERRARLLQQKMHALGRWVAEREAELKGGRNNWVRLEEDLEDCLGLRDRYVRQIIRWDPAMPDIVELLSAFAAEVAAECDRLRDLTLRCDSLAVD